MQLSAATIDARCCQYHDSLYKHKKCLKKLLLQHEFKRLIKFQTRCSRFFLQGALKFWLKTLDANWP